MKKKKELNSSCNNLDAEFGEVLKKKERHIVSWSQEEDDILREQIHLHGSENWGIIASKFKDKTTRQCRRRWFTYLNSDFKKGGWTPEEDLLLCEAQRVYGNRWTEIAKVVSGRTDNAVKNRFTTLCKKRAKREALAKENSTTSYVNLNNKRVVFRNGLNSNEGSENALKKIRTCISTIAENCKGGEIIDHMKQESVDKYVGSEFAQTFLRKDDPKVLALLQQAELLSSLAIKVKAEKTDQSLENAWMVLQDFLKQSKESQQLLEITNVDADFQLEKLKALEEGIRSSDEGSRSSRREVDVYESSPASSEYSTGWTLVSDVPRDERGECEEETAALHQEKLDQHCVSVTCTENEVKNMSAFEEVKGGNEEFNSPTHVTPLFRALAATIPSPKFSESEKHFLMKTLGLESSSQSIVTNPSQAPSCKRSLLHCL